ncbi:protein of unknown function [Xenorhabdus doucetiae]|uniref:Uncharacterized protein n=1 Tax=Xenorhabdus doucetiae TaxID=351671 RepID=A0A068QPF7_9GAMM|nr:protein of unknown function [Xenorhabdus doucetiae]
MSQFYDTFMNPYIPQSVKDKLAPRENLAPLLYFILDAKQLENSVKNVELHRTSLSLPL